jgi:hypothetical protein
MPTKRITKHPSVSSSMGERPPATKDENAEKARLMRWYDRMVEDRRDARIRENLRQESLYYGGNGNVWLDPETGEYRYDGDRPDC